MYKYFYLINISLFNNLFLSFKYFCFFDFTINELFISIAILDKRIYIDEKKVYFYKEKIKLVWKRKLRFWFWIFSILLFDNIRLSNKWLYRCTIFSNFSIYFIIYKIVIRYLLHDKFIFLKLFFSFFLFLFFIRFYWFFHISFYLSLLSSYKIKKKNYITSNIIIFTITSFCFLN